MSGGRNFFSEVTQYATKSRFGHVMVVLRNGLLIQATDMALTPPETDEGVFLLSLDEFLVKARKLSDILAMRPVSVDEGRLCHAADYLREHSPTYPSVGAIVLGFSCAAAGVMAGLPPAVRDRIVHYQFRLVADGPARMHCAEFAFRLYTAAGVAVHLASPVLDDVIAYSLSRRSELLALQLEQRRAEPGIWPDRLSKAAVYAVRESWTTIRERFDPAIERDHAGLVLPADLERSPTFKPVFDLTRRHQRWHVNMVA